MMNTKVLSGIVLDDEAVPSLGDLCYACSRHAEWIVELVDEGILQPAGREPAQWRFPGTSLQQDLHINLAGIALALDLMDEIESLRALVCRLE